MNKETVNVNGRNFIIMYLDEDKVWTAIPTGIFTDTKEELIEELKKYKIK